jgi:hypothetical protein
MRIARQPEGDVIQSRKQGHGKILKRRRLGTALANFPPPGQQRHLNENNPSASSKDENWRRAKLFQIATE